MTNESNSPASPDLHDFTTHRTSWRKAIEHLATQDDSGYWKHEVAAYDKAMAAFDADRAQRSGVSADPLPDLHAQIMNLPGKDLSCFSETSEHRRAYQSGHRDARLAAAELASQHQVKKGEPS